MAPLPAGQPDLHQAGAERGAQGAQLGLYGLARRRGPVGARGQAVLAGVILLALAAVAWHFNVTPRHEAFAAVPDTLRALAATAVLFGICGFGLVRLLLPAALRRYEPLWILPTGGCASGLALTALEFAGVPYTVSLPLVRADRSDPGLRSDLHGCPSAPCPDLAGFGQDPHRL